MRDVRRPCRPVWHGAGGYAVLFKGGYGLVDELNMGLYLFLHVVVAVRYFGDHGALTVFAVQKIGGFGEKFLFLFKFFMVVIADDII